MLRFSSPTTCSIPQRQRQRAILKIRCCISQTTLSGRQLTALGSHVPLKKVQHHRVQLRTVLCTANSQQQTAPLKAAGPAAAVAAATNIASQIAAASPAAVAPYILPTPPSNIDVGSLDVCTEILQHHATPGTTWPQSALQQVKHLAQDPNTLLLVVECGFWQESMEPNLSGKPARVLLLVTPRLGDSDQDTAAAAATLPQSARPEYKLQVLAMQMDKDGWPNGTLWNSPSAFEAKTTKVHKAYHRSSSVLLPPSSQPSSSSSSGTSGSLTLQAWLRQFYGRDLKRSTAGKTRTLASKLTSASTDRDQDHTAAAATTLRSSSSDSASTTIKQQAVPVHSAQRRRAGLGYTSTSGSSGSTASLGVSAPSSSSDDSRTLPSYQDAVAYRLDPATGRWPFYTYTQNWEALALIGPAVMASRDPKSMFDFVNSIDMKRLVLACDAEIAAGCPMHACRIYNLLLEVQQARQAAAAPGLDDL